MGIELSPVCDYRRFVASSGFHFLIIERYSDELEKTRLLARLQMVDMG